MLLTKKTYKKREELKVKKLLPYCLIALLPYCLIALLAISLVACKGNGGGSSNNSSTTTTTNTPLQGTWKDGDDETLVFNGSTFSSTSILSTSPVKSLAVAGTFRLDNGNIKITPTGITGVNGSSTYANKAEVEAGFGITIPYTIGTEENLGAYTISGTTLTLTKPGSSTSLTYTKQ